MGVRELTRVLPGHQQLALATATYTVPTGSGVNGLSFGMAIEEAGTLSTSGYALVNTGPNVPTVTVTGSPSPTTTGPVTYNVIVSGTGAAPTGSVTVSDGAGGTCTITSLTNGAGSCSITELAAVNPYSVWAQYYGDSSYSTAGGTSERAGKPGVADGRSQRAHSWCRRPSCLRCDRHRCGRCGPDRDGHGF